VGFRTGSPGRAPAAGWSPSRQATVLSPQGETTSRRIPSGVKNDHPRMVPRGCDAVQIPAWRARSAGRRVAGPGQCTGTTPLRWSKRLGGLTKIIGQNVTQAGQGVKPAFAVFEGPATSPIHPLTRGAAVADLLVGALGRIRTCNLLIRTRPRFVSGDPTKSQFGSNMQSRWGVSVTFGRREMISDGLGRSGTQLLANCWLFLAGGGTESEGFATAGVGSSGPHPAKVIEHPNQPATSNWSQRISKLAFIGPQAFGGPPQLGVRPFRNRWPRPRYAPGSEEPEPSRHHLDCPVQPTSSPTVGRSGPQELCSGASTHGRSLGSGLVLDMSC
jgi:hypothetical protein